MITLENGDIHKEDCLSIASICSYQLFTHFLLWLTHSDMLSVLTFSKPHLRFGNNAMWTGVKQSIW